MRVALRCDATLGGGVGHLARCLALAEAAQARGWEVVLVGRIEAPLAMALCAAAGLVVLPPPPDAEGMARLAAEHGVDLLHVDDYATGPGLHGQAAAVGVLLSSIQDGGFGRRPADLTIDPTLGPTGLTGSTGSADLAGVAFAPVRREVRALRAAARPGPESPAPSVLVVLGGTDAVGATASVVALVAGSAVPVGPVRVVAPPASHADVRAAGGDLDLSVQGPTGGLPALAAAHDVVVSAAGTTTVELACIGAAMALVPVVENQRAACAALVAAGAGVALGSVADVRAGAPGSRAELDRVLSDPGLRRDLSRRAHALVDGDGADRIVDAWERLLGEPSWTARPARREDGAVLLAWRNDEATRQASRSREPVGAQEHADWFDRVRADPGRSLYVVQLGGRPSGTVRFDRLDADLWEISLTIDPACRGRGYARTVVETAERRWRAEAGGGAAVLASVRPDNPASRQVFTALGFVRDDTRAEPGFEAYVRPGPTTAASRG